MNPNLRCEAQWTAVGATLYRLSDGWYWLDAAFMDRQGFLGPTRGEKLLTHLHPRPEYPGEPLEAVLLVYQSNHGRSFDEMTEAFSEPFKLQLFPTEPAIVI